MKIAIVGPTHPYKGGIAQQTTELAHRLTAAAHTVQLVSWKAMYPRRLYPGEQFVADGQPELKPFADTSYRLAWHNPAGWLQLGRRLRQFDEVILIWWVPTVQGPVYLSLLRAMGKKRPPVVLICHNVLPHEPRPGDKRLASAVFKRVDRLVVHTPAQAELAHSLTTTGTRTVDLPLALPGGAPKKAKKTDTLRHNLLFFGIVRQYKGLDILLRAMAQLPGIRLTVAGEFWDEAFYDHLIAELKLTDRVTLRKGYLPADELLALFAGADALVLPYRSATGGQNVAVAHTYGLPVIATAVGYLAGQVRDGVDGLLCQPDDVDSLAQAIQHFYEPGVAAQLRSGITTHATDAGWQEYIAALAIKK